MSTIRLLIVEDQTLMREGLRTVLDLEPGMSVIGEASDGETGLHKALALRPDIVLMDVQMPSLDGVQATAQLCTRWPEAQIIILTTFDRDDYVFQAVRAGARGFLLKDAPVEELVDTIRRVHAGEVFIQPSIALRALREAVRPTASPQASPLEPLSPREREVLVLLAQGHTNRDIAEQLHLSEGTIKNYVTNILAKLQADNRTHAAVIAREHGLAE